MVPMDPVFLVGFALGLCWMLKSWQQRQRMALLAHFLSRFRIEKNLEAVTQGYLRALGETDAARQEQVWELLRASERELCAQVSRLAADFGEANPRLARVSKLPFGLPFASALFPTFDMRSALAVHARGICRAIDASAAPSARDRAFTISAELFLLQHTCHWFCKSRLVASARMLSRHRTSYEQLISSVLPQTRAEYLALVRLVGRGG
jgi:hypothetical protein